MAPEFCGLFIPDRKLVAATVDLKEVDPDVVQVFYARVNIWCAARQIVLGEGIVRA